MRTKVRSMSGPDLNVSIFMGIDPVRLPRSCFVMKVLGQAPSDSHLKDRFSGTAADEDHSSAMFGCDARCERQSETSALLLAFADKGIEEAGANIVGNTDAVVFDAKRNLLFEDLKRQRYLRRTAR